MKAKRVVTAAVTFVLTAAVLFAVGIAFVPSIIVSKDNAREYSCRKYSEKLMELLEDKMSADEENMMWYNLVAEGNSSKLVSAIDNAAGGSEYAANYYIKFSPGRMKLLCREHPQALDVSMDIPDNPVHEEREYAEPKSAFVTGIHAYGTGIYFVGAPLDKANPKKMVFTDADNLSELFSDITVTASYAGGGERVLGADEYNIEVGTIDMSKPDSRTLIITYNNMPWGTMCTGFDINILANDRREPLIVQGGARYELSYWDWMDYFADSLDAPGHEYMDFSPSVVRDNGKFYYFPDGLSVMKDSEYNSSIMGARDTKVHDTQAHYVELDVKSPMYTADAPEKPKEGSMRVGGENADEIYVWQDEPSKEFDAGWVQIFGEVSKIDK